VCNAKRTALHFTATAQLLLDAGAAVNARCLLGSAVLHAAAAGGVGVGLICCLLKAGADATATDTVGSTPADVALAFGHSTAAALLQRAAADRQCKQQQQQQQQNSVALPLPEFLTLSKAAVTWHSSSDLKHRRKHYMHLQQLKLLAIVAMQMPCLEVELYRTAPSLAEYENMSTVAARVEAFCRTWLQAAAVADSTDVDSRGEGSAAVADSGLAVAVAVQQRLTDEAAGQLELQVSLPASTPAAASAAATIAAAAAAAAGTTAAEEAEAALVAAAAEPVSLQLVERLQECVARGSWRCAETDLPVRRELIGKIAQSLCEAIGCAELALSKAVCLPAVIATHIEAVLYVSASTSEMYSSEVESAALALLQGEKLSGSSLDESQQQRWAAAFESGRNCLILLSSNADLVDLTEVVQQQHVTEFGQRSLDVLSAAAAALGGGPYCATDAATVRCTADLTCASLAARAVDTDAASAVQRASATAAAAASAAVAALVVPSTISNTQSDQFDAAAAAAVEPLSLQLLEQSLEQLLDGARDSWRCAERDTAVRRQLLSLIAQSLRDCFGTMPVVHSTVWIAADMGQQMAQQMELTLYMSASSFEMYSSDSAALAALQSEFLTRLKSSTSSQVLRWTATFQAGKERMAELTSQIGSADAGCAEITQQQHALKLVQRSMAALSRAAAVATAPSCAATATSTPCAAELACTALFATAGDTALAVQRASTAAAAVSAEASAGQGKAEQATAEAVADTVSTVLKSANATPAAAVALQDLVDAAAPVAETAAAAAVSTATVAAAAEHSASLAVLEDAVADGITCSHAARSASFTAQGCSDSCSALSVAEPCHASLEAVEAAAAAAAVSTHATVAPAVQTAAATVPAAVVHTDSTDSSSTASSEQCSRDSVISQMLQHLAERVAAAELHATATAQAAAAAAAALTVCLSSVERHQAGGDTHALAAAVAAAAAASASALAAFNAQGAALQALHSEQGLQSMQQRIASSSDQQSTAAQALAPVASAAAAAADAADAAYESDEDDCPPLAPAGCYSDACTNSTAAVVETAATAAAASSSSSGSSKGSRVSDAVQKQPLQQLPCVQCGKLTKRRCRRCQAVYYCSEECQIQCFKDPEHRAQCEAAAAAAAAAIGAAAPARVCG
jgi:trimeric autotransporter adhesin